MTGARWVLRRKGNDDQVRFRPPFYFHVLFPSPSVAPLFFTFLDVRFSGGVLCL
jgi:hypothetical protein